jgi:hypothetical protein
MASQSISYTNKIVLLQPILGCEDGRHEPLIPVRLGRQTRCQAAVAYQLAKA